MGYQLNCAKEEVHKIEEMVGRMLQEPLSIGTLHNCLNAIESCCRNIDHRIDLAMEQPAAQLSVEEITAILIANHPEAIAGEGISAWDATTCRMQAVAIQQAIKNRGGA